MPYHRGVDKKHEHRCDLCQDRRYAQANNKMEFFPLCQRLPISDLRQQDIIAFIA